MRSFHAIFIGLLVALLVPSLASATPTTSIELNADAVDYYSNRYILTADGHVRAVLTDGTIVSGDTFSIDLKLNRFLIAGNVHIDGRTIHLRAAAVAGYPDLDRTYVLTAGPKPDRWTYFGQDFSDTHAGRQQPGDAFYFPDLTHDKPYIVSNSATLFLKNNVEFPVGSRIYLLGVYTPTPGFVINYSANPNFYQNAFAGAIFDVGVPYHGAADAISAFHIRGDYYNGLYVSFDQHFVHNQDYAVFSVNPLTQNQRQFNGILYKRLSPDVEARVFYQLSADSRFLGEPWSASSYANGLVNWRLGKYAMSVNVDQYNNGLIGNPPDDPYVPLNPAGHPFDGQFAVQSFENEIRAFRYLGVPIKFQYRFGFGQIHDALGIQTITGETFGGVQYDTQYQHFFGATVYSTPVRIFKQTTLSAKYDEQQQWYSLPHHVITENFSATIAYTPLVVKKPAFYASYNILNVGDYYGAQQRLAYPEYPVDTVTTQFGTFSGLQAFDGFATSHNITGSMIYAPNPYFTLNLTAQRFWVTPRPVPGLGGQPPLIFTPDLRIRLTKTILVDISNTYNFNWANQRWNPTTYVQVSP